MSQNPYEPSAHTGSANSNADYRYRSLKSTSVGIAIGLAVFCFAKILLVVVQTIAYWAVSINELDADNSFRLVVDVGRWGSWLALTISFVWLAACIAFFTYRANANLRSLGYVNRLNQPEPASIFWFIPIINLYKPYQEMADVYSESVSRNLIDHSNKGVNTAIVGTWWGFWLGGGFLDRLSWFSYRQGMGGETYIAICWASSIFFVIAAIFLANLVLSISRGQEKLNEEIVDIF